MGIEQFSGQNEDQEKIKTEVREKYKEVVKNYYIKKLQEGIPVADILLSREEEGEDYELAEKKFGELFGYGYPQAEVRNEVVSELSDSSNSEVVGMQEPLPAVEFNVEQREGDDYETAMEKRRIFEEYEQKWSEAERDNTSPESVVEIAETEKV